MKYEYWLVALTVLQIGDVYTTERILGANGRELNPVMASLFKRFGMSKTLIAKAILVFCAGVMFLELVPVVLIPVTLMYVGVVAWNLYQMSKS